MQWIHHILYVSLLKTSVHLFSISVSNVVGSHFGLLLLLTGITQKNNWRFLVGNRGQHTRVACAIFTARVRSTTWGYNYMQYMQFVCLFTSRGGGTPAHWSLDPGLCPGGGGGRGYPWSLVPGPFLGEGRGGVPLWWSWRRRDGEIGGRGYSSQDRTGVHPSLLHPVGHATDRIWCGRYASCVFRGEDFLVQLNFNTNSRLFCT